MVEWNSKPVKAIDKAFANTVAGLGPDVTPHVLRHTAATWLMQSGTNPWEAAGFLSMSVEMLLEAPEGFTDSGWAVETGRQVTSVLPASGLAPDPAADSAPAFVSLPYRSILLGVSGW